MNGRTFKKIIALILCMVMVLSVFPAVYADSIPTQYLDYVVDGRVDYKELHVKYFQVYYRPLTPPTSRFTVTVKRNGTTISTGYSDQSDVLYAQIGDEIVIENTSKLGSGTGWKKCDFQVTKNGSTVSTISSISGMESYEIKTTDEATYILSLCIMDNTPMDKTEGWGNWSYNGFKVPGTNPGTGSTGSDFPGWWYYTKLTVQIREPEYTLQEKHIDTNSGKVLYEKLHEGITSSTKTTSSLSFEGYRFIGSRAGYTWNDIANGTTENIESRTASFGKNRRNAFHYYYYELITPEIPDPPPPGTATIVVYHRNKYTGENLSELPPDYSRSGIPYGTYTITAPPAPDGYTFDSSSTPSPQTVTVNAANNYKEIVFYYKPNVVVQKKRPVAILTGPEQVMAGDDFKVSAKDSYATEPGATIKYYLWDINRYTPSWPPIEDRDKTVTLWSDAVEGDYCGVEVTVVDSNGMTDDDRISIEVLPAEPTPVITITGDLRENRKVTLSAANSKAPKHFPIDTSKTKWEITAVSGGTAADIKYKGSLTGATTVDTLYKKAGKYHIKLTVELTVGVPRSTEMDITIKPDLPPIADFSTPTTIYRNPKDSNNAAAIITNLSTSPDGDPIWKSACLEVYDSDNDGNFDEETCYYSVNGNSWLTTGKTYAQIKASGFDIFSLTDSNPGTYTHKSKQVGKYIYEITVIEGIPESTTIPEFISINDYRRNNTWQ